MSASAINGNEFTGRAYYASKVKPAGVLASKINTPNAEQLNQVLRR